MSSVKEIRESADVKLTKLGARADAFQATPGGKQGPRRSNQTPTSRKFVEPSTSLRLASTDKRTFPDERKQAIHSLVDNLECADGRQSNRIAGDARVCAQQIHEASRRNGSGTGWRSGRVQEQS